MLVQSTQFFFSQLNLHEIDKIVFLKRKKLNGKPSRRTTESRVTDI